ncbi:unnamed protein product [Adineta steineri]|uniref:Uncharacterized protein n=1 Tax=Adineta steineri TaxID=433720 RepID=A0A815BH91_9BILA|nr:unnamed protein product [Adineta steineri]CAF4011369.1 unnamed protein product [Adineta steineri]
MFKKIKQKYGQLDAILNCAGIVIFYIQDLINRVNEFNPVLNVNVCGKCGVIVNTESIAAYESHVGQVAYAESKGAIASMTLPLVRDLSNMDYSVLYREKIQRLLDNMVPFLSRLGRSDDFAHLAQTIVENPYLTGEVIRLNGAIRAPPFNINIFN